MKFTDYATADEVADKLGIHLESARRLIRQGDIPARRWGKLWLIKRTDLDQFAAGYAPNMCSPAAQKKHARRVALRHAIEGLRGE